MNTNQLAVRLYTLSRIAMSEAMRGNPFIDKGDAFRMMSSSIKISNDIYKGKIELK